MILILLFNMFQRFCPKMDLLLQKIDYYLYSDASSDTILTFSTKIYSIMDQNDSNNEFDHTRT